MSKNNIKIGKLNGNVDKEKNTITLEGLYLIENIFEKDFLINNKLYKIDVQSTFKFFKPISELNDLEIDDAINQISSYRFTFLSVKADLQEIITNLELEYKIWFTRALNDSRINLENLKARSSERITEKQIFSKFIKDPENERRYQEFNKQLAAYKKQLDLVIGLNEILEQRGWFLKTWSENRYAFKGGKGRGSSI